MNAPKWELIHIMADNIDFTVDDGIATLTLNRPEKLNAFTYEMLDRWLEILDECNRRDDIRVVIITGTGRAFTTGGDVGSFKGVAALSAAGIKAELTGFQRLTRAIALHDKPMIAAMNGLATGGGLDIALACDLRFAAESARMAETYVKMALLPGMGGAYLLPRLIGLGKALEMLWSAEFIDAREAERIGIVNRVFPDAELMAGTLAFARNLAESAPISVRLIKRVARMGLGKDLDMGLELVAANMPVARTSKDHKEAVAAFQEKRKPLFEGR